MSWREALLGSEDETEEQQHDRFVALLYVVMLLCAVVGIGEIIRG